MNEKNESGLFGTERSYYEKHIEELRLGYESECQMLVALWEKSSPAVAALARRRFRDVSFTTSFGRVTLRCREGVAPDGRWTCPAMPRLGLRPNQRYSPDMERRMAVLAVETGSYEKASRVADEAAWFKASDGAVHSTVERMHAAASKILCDSPCNGAAGPGDTLVIMADGWNARHRGRNWGRHKGKENVPGRIHWYEIRSAVMFKLSELVMVSGGRKAIMRKHTLAMPAETTPYAFGAGLHRQAMRMGLMTAENVFFIMDGGIWLWEIYNDRFVQCSKAMLDFYHLSQHLHGLAKALYGDDSDKAEKWCHRLLHSLKHDSPKKLVSALDKLIAHPPDCDEQTIGQIRKQNAYFRKHSDNHMEYAENSALGVPIGSGSMESLCSQFQNRLKRTGQFWSKKGFAALLDITVKHWNGELDALWKVKAA